MAPAETLSEVAGRETVHRADTEKFAIVASVPADGEQENLGGTMSEVTVRVDATGGVRVRSGESVQPGQCLGRSPDGSGEPCLCPVQGAVQSIEFDADNHQFVVIILAGDTDRTRQCPARCGHPEERSIDDYAEEDGEEPADEET
jgi:hypothetical protein